MIEDAAWEIDGNVLAAFGLPARGTGRGLGAAAHTVHEIFQTQRVEHAFLGTESTSPCPGPMGALKGFSGGQGVWDDRPGPAVLGSDRSGRRSAGSTAARSAGKETWSNQAQRPLAAWLLQRAREVHSVRARAFLLHPKRHPIPMAVPGRVRCRWQAHRR